MSVAYIVEALFEETLRELDQRAEHELWRIGNELSYWLRHMLMRMPCDTWRYEFDRQIAKMAREHVIVAEESRQAWTERLRACNEAAEEDARAMGSAEAVRARMREYFKWPDPPQYPHDKPAPFDPDYPQLRRSGNAIMEDYPLEQWVELAHFWLQSYRVPQEIKDAFVGWMEEEERRVLGLGMPSGAVGADDNHPHAVCFAAGTLVLTRRGMVPIEAVNCGDHVPAVTDETPLREPEWCEVLQAYHNRPAHLIEIQIDDEAVIRASHGHPWYVAGRGWTSTSALQVGDQLVTAAGGRASITGCRALHAAEPVYNLRIDRCGTYFVAGAEGGACVLVHNQSPADDDAVPPRRGPKTGGHWKDPAAPYNTDWILDEPFKLDDGRVVTSIRYDNDLPVFDDISHGKDVYIAISGDDKVDQAAALAKWKKENPGMNVPDEYVFHHDLRDARRVTLPDGSTYLHGRVQLVPKKANAIAHAGSASYARRIAALDGTSKADRIATGKRMNSELLNVPGGAAEVRKAAAKVAKRGKTARTVMRAGRRIIPVIGGLLTVITFEQDAEAHGIPGAVLRATPLLGDFLAVYDIGSEIAQSKIDDTNARAANAYDAANAPADIAAATAARQTAEAFNRIAGKVKVTIPYIDEHTVDRLQAALRDYNGRARQINAEWLNGGMSEEKHEQFLKDAEAEMQKKIEDAVQATGSQKGPA